MTDSGTGFDPLKDLLTRPELFVHKLDLGIERALIVEMNRTALRDASFLDDRVLSAQTRGQWVRLSSLRQAIAQATPANPLHFIFHTGHVGSTLLSRMIESAGTSVALREPMPMRTLADTRDMHDKSYALIAPAALDRLALDQMILWSRGYEDSQATIVKATSATGRIAPWLLDLWPTAKAVYLNLKAEPFLATLLAGPNSAMDLRGHGPERIRRLERLAGGPLAPLYTLSPGELAALTWATETLTQRAAVDALPGRIMALDFDALLEDPSEHLGAVLAHFNVAAPSGHVDNIARHPVLASYAKATTERYSPQLRAEVLGDSRRRNGEEIRRGLLWIEAFARTSPAGGQLLLA